LLRQTSESLSLMGLREPFGLDEDPARLSEAIFNKIETCGSMSCEELQIHSFLDEIGLNQVNISMFLENLRKIESPDVKRSFSKQAI
jgi:hypothetical protein